MEGRVASVAPVPSWRDGGLATTGRRQFLSLSAGAAATLAALGRWDPLAAAASSTGGDARTPVSELRIERVDVPMIDGRVVPAWGYRRPGGDERAVPGPWITAYEGQEIRLTVTNTLDDPHGFGIAGVPASHTGPIPPGETVEVRFAAPPAGLYLYEDLAFGLVARVLGLHGPLTVLPAELAPERVAVAGMPSHPCPYTDPPAKVRQLFSELTSGYFNGGKAWDPTRQWVWVFGQIDPELSRRIVVEGERLTDGAFVDAFLPTYFTINGVSGYLAAHVPDIAITGYEGEPALIRMVNAGLAWHSPHIHGNHCYTLTDGGRVLGSLAKRDSWSLGGGGRTDVLLPYHAPPDVERWPPKDDIHFPLMYPMHCHMEMSQTANGGDYPNGAVTHWTMEGPMKR